jgi:hypothetical protein
MIDQSRSSCASAFQLELEGRADEVFDPTVWGLHRDEAG